MSGTRTGRSAATDQSDSAAPGVDARPRDVVFVLVPDHSFIAFSSAVEPLRMANRMRGERRLDRLPGGVAGRTRK